MFWNTLNFMPLKIYIFFNLNKEYYWVVREFSQKNTDNAWTIDFYH